MIKKLFLRLIKLLKRDIFLFGGPDTVVFNAVIPLMDKTEARYAEIARLMAETGEWVVLQ